MRVATAEQMRQLDNAAIHDSGIPSLLLMERAAQGIAAEALKLLGDKRPAYAVVFAGPGNNGGDGVATARLLLEAGVSVSAFLVGKREKMSPDTRAMEKLLEQAGGELQDLHMDFVGHNARINRADVFIDALFGIGLNSDIRGLASEAIQRMNDHPAPVVAADIASGIEADTGRVLGTATKAAVTVTFTLPKAGHYVGQGGLCTGRLVVHDIGIPRTLVDGLETNVTVIDAELVRSFLPRRPADGHKGDFGRDYILAGSVGYTGAPILASKAAVRSGAGLVFLGVPQKIYQIAAIKSDEAMPSPLPDDEAGRLTESALMPVLQKLAECDVALLGPGLGRSEGVNALVRNILQTVQYPIILDADGLNAIASHIGLLDARRECPTILTPHDGEFARLGGDLSNGDRLGAARAFAKQHGCLLVLKGHCTLIVLPNGEAFLNTTGNNGMAKGGSGDVLSGILLGLMGQDIHPVKATVAGVWLHGRAGDLAAQAKGTYAMTPSDLIDYLPAAFREVTEDSI
ncbi:MAG: NAD(P)H-hydrate dehydratase [Oscillospiraceae bacterium]|nr:NAD(P)H-hydrate dehydratase [Oscillospiraceae bacterium]